MALAIGKPNYTSNSGNFAEKTTFFKLGHATTQQRTLIMRIAPPLGDLAEKGIWSRFIKQHFGYRLSYVTAKGEKKAFPATFLCIEKTDREGNVTQPCPECEEIKAQATKLKTKTEEMTKAGKTEEEIDRALAYIKSWKKDHNIDKKWNMIAKDVAGRWGVLTISHTCYKLLKGKSDEPGIIDTLVAQGKDPLGVEGGNWFRFTRNGSNFNDIADIPSIEQEEIEPGTYRRKLDTLTQTDLEALEKMPSLMTLGRSLTYEQIKMLVESGGDEEVVRAVMGIPAQSSRSETSPDPVPPKTEQKAAPAPAPKAEAPAAVDPEAEEIAKMEAMLAAMKAKKAPAAASPTPAATKPAATPAPSAKLQSDMDVPMEDFLKRYENK